MTTMTGREVLRAIADGALAEAFEWSDGPTWGSVENTWAIHDFTQERTVFRRKPKTRVINGFTVPAPETKAPQRDDEYWTLMLTDPELVSRVYWGCDGFDTRAFSRGLVFLDRDAAIANAKAMCGIDPQENDS